LKNRHFIYTVPWSASRQKLYEEEKGKDTMQNLISIIAFSSKFEDKKPRTLEELFQQNVRYIYMKN